MEFDLDARHRIAEALRARRAALGLSQEEAAARSGGMVSTANLRIFEGTGRSGYREKSLIGVARAMSWPDDALARIAAGAEPASLPTVVHGGVTAAPSSALTSEPGADARSSTTIRVGDVQLVTHAELDALRREVSEQREAIAELGRRLIELSRTSPTAVAAFSGAPAEVAPAGRRTPTPPRVTSSD